MTTKKPSAIAGMRRGLSGGQAEPADLLADLPQSPKPGKAVKPKPVRVTLDLDPELYRAFNEWIAKVTPDVPRLTLASALRGMIRVTTTEPFVMATVVDLLRRDTAR